MITNLGEIFNDLLLRSGKDKRGGFITPNNFNIAIAVINERYMNTLLDNFEETQEITVELIPFVKTLGSPQYGAMTFTPVLASNPNNGGYAEIPADFWYEARANYMKLINVGCSSEATYTPIELVSQHVFDAIMQDSNVSPIMNPKESYPVMVIQNGKFFVYPYIQRCSFTYIKQPVKPVFDYDIISGIPVFLPAGEVHVNSSVLPQGAPSQTVEFEYREPSMDTIVEQLKAYFGIANESQWNLQTQIPPKIP